MGLNRAQVFGNGRDLITMSLAAEANSRATLVVSKLLRFKVLMTILSSRDRSKAADAVATWSMSFILL